MKNNNYPDIRGCARFILFIFSLLAFSQPLKADEAGVVLTFDDESITQWFDYFNGQTPEVKVTFFTSGWHTYTSGEVEMLRTLQQRGHEIAAHTYDHSGVGETYGFDPNRIDEYINEQILPALNNMRNDGFNPVSFAYPFGEHNEAYDNAVKAYFPYLRGTYADVSKGLSAIDQIYHNEPKSYDYLDGDRIDTISNRTIDDIRAALQRAKNNNEIITLYAHRIVNTSQQNAIRESALTDIITEIKAQGLKFYTFEEAYQVGNKSTIATQVSGNNVRVTWSGIDSDFIGIVPANEDDWRQNMPKVEFPVQQTGDLTIPVINPLNQQEYRAIFYKSGIRRFISEPFFILNNTIVPPSPVILTPIGITNSDNGSVTFNWNAVLGASSYSFVGYVTDANGVTDFSTSIFDKNASAEDANCLYGGVCSSIEAIPSSVSSAVWKIRAHSITQKGDYSDKTFFTLDTISPVITLQGVNPVTVDLNAIYVDAGATATDNRDPIVTVSIDDSNVNTSLAGTYTVMFTATDVAGNSATATRTVVVSDNNVDAIPPVITLQGVNPVTIALNSTYVDAGATATDNRDPIVTVSIDDSNVNTSLAATYTVTFTATDIAGNVATATRTVVVSDNNVDAIPPVITLQGINPVTIALNSTYVDAGATATDNRDPLVTVSIDDSNVNTSLAGTYTVTFTATDVAGNSVTATRTVMVMVSNVDIIPPVITLLGANPTNISINTPYVDAGATATDNNDPIVTVSIDDSAVNTSLAGTYTVTFIATDVAGNSATTSRTVTVMDNNADTTPPVITLLGANPVNLSINTPYVDAGATATDNNDPSVIVIADTSAVNTTQAGNYTVTYTATDLSGNTATVTRTVRIQTGLVSPSIISPKGNSQSTGGTVLLSWVAVPGATSYDYSGYEVNARGRIIYSNRIFDGEANAVEAGCVSGSVCSLTKNTLVTSGVWKIRANFGEQRSDYSDKTFFTLTETGGNNDSTAPIITLQGSNPVTINQNTVYVDAGATATDNNDPLVTVSIDDSSVNTTLAGTYAVTFVATDSAGNTATVTRTVVVSGNGGNNDTTAPVITLQGISPVTVNLNSVYVDAGATAIDNNDPVVTVSIDDSAVNTSLAGTYTVTFTATDMAGNIATTARTVVVSGGNNGDTLVPPSIISPAGPTQSIGGIITLSWNAVAGATSYDYSGYQANARGRIIFSNRIFDGAISAADAGCAGGGVCGTTKSVSVTSGAWKIRTNTDNEKSDYTSYTHFVINP